MAYSPDDFAQGAGILAEANDYMDAAVKILRRDLGQRVAAPSKTVDASDQLTDTGHVSRLGAATGDRR